MKLRKKLMIALCIISALFVGVFTCYGYRQYKEAVDNTPLSVKIAMIKQDDSFVGYDAISPYLLQATIAIEDHRFFQHSGFDVLATGRAFVGTVFGFGRSGGSTITQQLAKNLYFGYDPSLIRKVSELFVAHDLEANYQKTDILTVYVNVINYGDNHIGIKEAANGYFDTEPKDLTLAQASLLAGLPQSPANYQLSNHFEQAKMRQKQVLQAMVRRNMITEQEMEAALKETNKEAFLR